MIKEELRAFEENLAKKPYCTDDLTYGLLIRPKLTALKKKYIQHNKPTSLKVFVLDCDYAGVAEFIGDNHLPPPNFIASNKKTGRSHVYYILETEVYLVDNARRGPIKYAAIIHYQLCQVLKADPGYSNFMSKNPFSPEWEVRFYRKEPWTLGEFEEWITLPAKIPTKAMKEGLGRNCTLFEDTRHWSYRQVLNFRLQGARQMFFDAVLDRAREYNRNNFPVPLSDSEVKATAKSIAKWTWNKYTGQQVINAAFIARQSAQGKKSGETRRAKSEDKALLAHMFWMFGLKQIQIAGILNAKKQTISDWLNCQKVFNQKISQPI
ncbi:MAG: replication initiation protein [Roseateles asaccharophilus]|uniref:replication initiation protein n=1 Tax=Roseateles asaccharophilus TaxID=582607 RepID=UPI0039196C0D